MRQPWKNRYEGNERVSEGMLGADLESLRDLARAVNLSGQGLESTATNLQAAVARTRWAGFDAERFRSRWASNMRPTLRTASASLENISKLLLAQADEQERTSADTGGSGGGGSVGPGSSGGNLPVDTNGWDDAFTDPNYKHAPGGLEWGYEALFGEDGSQFQGLTNALKFAADKFTFNIGLANADDLAAMMPKFAGTMKVAGKGLAGLGIVLGGLDIASGIANEDPFRVADGGISAALSVAAIAATATGVGAPVGAVIGAAGLVWGLASMISGDVPLTKRIWDGGAAVVGGVQDAVGWLGGKLGFG